MTKKIKILFLLIYLFSIISFTNAVIEIDNNTSYPITITKPGSYLVVDNLIVNEEKDGIIILADNVTIDFNGHYIEGNGEGEASGITNDKFAGNITIKNGNVTGFGGCGIRMIGNSIVLGNMKSQNNGDSGIVIATYTNLGYSNNIITNCTATKNKGQGFHASYSTIKNCSSIGNSREGYAVSNCSLSFSTSINNQNGIDSGFSTISNCVAVQNLDKGIILMYASIAKNCISNHNNGEGYFTSHSTLLNSSSSFNKGDGIYAYGLSHIEGNKILLNNGRGIYIKNSYNYILKNTVNSNTSGNIIDAGSNNIVPLSGDNANITD